MSGLRMARTLGGGGGGCIIKMVAGPLMTLGGLIGESA